MPAGKLTLHALLWRPSGAGPFPAVLYCHGGAAMTDPQQAATLGPLFAGHGYAFLFLYRRGAGLSADQGTVPDELMRREQAAHGDEARDRLRLKLLDEHVDDALGGLAWLRARPDVDPKRIAVAGHAFGGMLALLVAERDHGLNAVVEFAPASDSWASSQPLRARLMAAVNATTAPVFFIYADNDYSVAPGEVLATELLSQDKPRRIEVYGGVGATSEDGRDLVYLGVDRWERDVFAFLDDLMRK